MTARLVCRLWIFLKSHLFRLVFRLAPALRFSAAKLATVETLAFGLYFWFIFVGFGLGIFAGRSVFVTLALPQLFGTLFPSTFSLLLRPNAECGVVGGRLVTFSMNEVLNLVARRIASTSVAGYMSRSVCCLALIRYIL